MYPEKSYNSQMQGQPQKVQERRVISYQEMITMITAAKKNEERPIYTQQTPKPNRKILLYDNDKNKHLFPLVKDKDIGIASKYQQIVIESYHDDDKQTSSTQMRAGMMQTVQDLYGVMSQYQNGSK